MDCEELEQWTEQRDKRHTNTHMYTWTHTHTHTHRETVNITKVAFRIRKEKMNYSVYGAGIISYPYGKLSSK